MLSHPINGVLLRKRFCFFLSVVSKGIAMFCHLCGASVRADYIQSHNFSAPAINAAMDCESKWFKTVTVPSIVWARVVVLFLLKAMCLS